LTTEAREVRLSNPLLLSAKNDSRHLSWARAGAWLFTRRTWIPVPLALALLVVRPESHSTVTPVIGTVIVVCAELLRLWAVRHIGVISRTRSDRLGPLVSTGPFAIVRNPLYIGNMALWTGFALTARLAWLAPVFLAVLGVEYHAIVRWEEGLLEARRGEAYREYAARVPRWIPAIRTERRVVPQPTHPWRDTLFSERGTLIAIAIGYVLLWIKSGL
jgi:protein-S-isoprenylcysteine O-methyltransferase Ste14